MSNLFNFVQPAKVKRTGFDLSHDRKLSLKMGDLVPVLCQEVVPGDKWEINSEAVVKFHALLAPIMHRINVYIHYFYVPNRLVWRDWEDFITNEQELSIPTEKMDASIPVGGLADHLGLPTHIATEVSPADINVLPFRGYFKIWNDYFRDENLQTEIDVEDATFNDTIITSELLKRCWEKDYFTSALPWAQKGDPVTMEATIDYADPALFTNRGGAAPTGAASFVSVDGTHSKIVDAGHPADFMAVENLDGITIDVNELRRATRLQRWLERNARAGTRYVEQLLAHFNVYSDDARLQRPEYIGGGMAPVMVSDIMAQSTTSVPPYGPVGIRTGNAVSVGNQFHAYKAVKEHGYIFGIMSVMPETAYFEGVPRMFSRLVNTDFYWPEFADLGEQEVKYKEIYYTDNNAQNEATFGYQSRYAEYKYIPNTVHGLFRTDFLFWHMARDFSSLPNLNEEFVESNPTTRVFNTTELKDEQLHSMIFHKIKAVRPMPFYNNPRL